MTAFYSEWDPYCAQWLRNLIKKGLIPDGIVDERDIRLLQPADLAGFSQVHLFGGLGGWAYAGRLAGWPDDRPLWTGSCPCQPFSVAGKRAGFADDRHLWPVWRGLIQECRPSVLVGEQVASASQWLALVHGDLEALGYAVGAIPVEAASVGAPHRRDRYWLVAADAFGHELRHEPGRRRGANGAGAPVAGDDGPAGAMAHPDQQPLGRPPVARPERHNWELEPDVGRVAHGVPARVDRLRALGNAIVPQVGAEVLMAVMEMDP